MRDLLVSLLAAFTLTSFSLNCSSSRSATGKTGSAEPRAVREFRAAWVATVANINWPSQPGLSSEQQQTEAISLLDSLQSLHFNAVVLQVRPQCDALYPSKLEPWSYFLTGKQGQAPEPFYDPLQFWIEAAHQRGLELHVWLNPYRAHHKDGKEISDQSVVKTHPRQVVFLKEGYWWMDPAQKETQDQTAAVVNDLVARYDIDGVHFDDYFYPYPSYNGNADFPDSLSWEAYRDSGGRLSRGDWRREAVNQLIQRLYREIKAAKPWVKFGLSPFGIWRPGYPEGIGGFDQYDQLYADARKWLNKGWIDYFAPQLYWPINRAAQSFPVLLGWWSRENKKNRHLWPGISLGRDTSAKNITEVMNQLMISRGMLPESPGLVHWNIFSLTRKPVLSQALRKGPYALPALVPSSPWISRRLPAAPKAACTLLGDSIKVQWNHLQAQDIFNWVIYYRFGEKWIYEILPASQHTALLPAASNGASPPAKLQALRLSAVDRNGNESKQVELDLPIQQ